MSPAILVGLFLYHPGYDKWDDLVDYRLNHPIF
ncbi:hypothetical protein LVISKB_0339 [Levilactobacillus brevis KB290]|uniref:Uncharacterized protein n=1 Tax=Levilactobacillus brevis KB290 TaxID=1001583 RepID=M5AB06_LEVBR|nr:hypothetical protein LVISKB_0339 [Levilactobacillus brevis KB290]